MNIIETYGLTRRFWRTEAVHDLNLAVPQGSITALLGANGAGKSTTLKLLMNLIEPTSGSARVLGVDSRRLGEAERGKIGYVAEGQQLPFWMTVRELLDYLRPFYPSWDVGFEQELLSQFDLPSSVKLRNLSRGMLMKASLVSTLAFRPRLLVLDEPFSGLDPLVRDELVQGLLSASVNGDCSVIVSSHDIDEIERLADRVVYLERGRLRVDEAAEALQRRFRRVDVTGSFVGLPSPDEIGWACSGHRAQFIATGYDGEATESKWHLRFPDAVVSVHPMSLREVFVAMEKAEKAETKGVRS